MNKPTPTKGLAMPKPVTAWNDNDYALFHRIFKNKSEAKKEVLNHPLLAKISYVLYNGKKYSIKEVYNDKF